MSLSCYRCGSSVGAGRYCLRCGADLQLYRRIVRLSNRYYNLGLERARTRDLTGAVEALTRSLSIDKHNVPARNLLGLVLYEMGETVDALCEWVVSTGDQPENNPASAYVKRLQDRRTELDNDNQAIRKYNAALEQARHGGEDLAIIQLQWVLEAHPRMLKAHALMALLQLQEGDSAKAEKEARLVLKADKGNLFCQNLLAQTEGRHHKAESGRAVSLAEEKLRSGLEAVSAEGKRVSSAMKGRPGFLLRFLLGMVILICAFMGIIRPTVTRRRQTAVNSAVALYAERLEGARQELMLSEEKSAAYEILLQMERLDYIQDRDKIEALFAELKVNSADTALYEELYAAWRDQLAPSETIADRTLPSAAD